MRLCSGRVGKSGNLSEGVEANYDPLPCVNVHGEGIVAKGVSKAMRRLSSWKYLLNKIYKSNVLEHLGLAVTAAASSQVAPLLLSCPDLQRCRLLPILMRSQQGHILSVPVEREFKVPGDALHASLGFFSL